MDEQEAVMFPQTRVQEEAHLRQTYAIVKKNVQRYRGEVKKMSDDVDAMLAHFHDNDDDMHKMLHNTITMNENMKRALFRNEQALRKAYFGRIDYCERGTDRQECVYIGKGGIFRDTSHIEVVDWRAPISAAYYESKIGKCHYTPPNGKAVAIDVSLKRTYEIDGETLIDFYDSETVANDELLTKYLAKNKQAVLGEIIASIQKEQDDIIRKSPFFNVLVQGVAGSGKTTVAMHRISFILYNYAERFKAQDFYIIGSNHILLNYITGVLPELDVYGARQMTMEELFTRLLYEDWDEKKYRVIPTERNETRKGTSEWFSALATFCDVFEWKEIRREDVVLNRKQFVQGFYDGSAGVHDITGSVPTRPEDLVPLVNRDEVERYIRENPTVSMQSKIEMLNLKLENRVDTELTGKHVSYTAEEKKEIRKAYRSRYGKKGDKRDIYEIYHDFITLQNSKGLHVQTRTQEFDVYDLAALSYLYKRINETDPIKEASHVVIDEAQDFGMMVYRALKFCIPGCTFTVMGDVSQNIHFGYGLSDWEELKKLILTGERDSFGILKKSYRNTVEISDFASNILRHGSGRVYVAEPVIRHGEEVVVEKCTTNEQMLTNAVERIRGWQAKDLNTIAVVCRDRVEADLVHEQLAKKIELQDNHLETAVFGEGVIVLPVEYTKGLEFDAVLILEPNRKNYPVDGGHAKLLYVAATRALHELCILHCAPLTGLITDPLPENAQIEEINEEAVQKTYFTPEHEQIASVLEKMINRERNEILKKPKRETSYMKADKSAGKAVEEAKIREKVKLQEKLRTQEKVKTHETAVMHEVPKTPASVAEVFGERPLPAVWKLAGRAITDQAVRWVEKRGDGLYIVSRYGTLRLSPQQNDILRVTFVRGQSFTDTENNYSGWTPDQFWLYRDKRDCVELKTDTITVIIEKSTGCLQYFNEAGKKILSERAKESRLIETNPAGRNRMWQFFDWQKNEEVYGMYDGVVKKSFRVNGRSGYLSDGKRDRIPWLYSGNGYAITILSKNVTIACDTPIYGSMFYTEGEPQLDYCVVFGNSKEEIIKKIQNNIHRNNT